MKHTDPSAQPVPAFNPVGDPSGIPQELRAINQWIAWRFVWDEKRKAWAKQPTDPRTGRTFDCHHPANWSSFDKALAGAARYKCDGLGFVFTENDPYCGIDLDGVIHDDGENPMQSAPLADDVLKRLPRTYTERSVSNTGIHLIVRYDWGKGNNNQELGIEVYSQKRYFAFSGFNHYGPDGTSEVAELPEAAAEYLRNFFVKKETPRPKQEQTQLPNDQALFAPASVPEEPQSEFPNGTNGFGYPAPPPLPPTEYGIPAGQILQPQFELPTAMPTPIPAPVSEFTQQSAGQQMAQELLSPSRIIPAKPSAKPILLAETPEGAIRIHCGHCVETWAYPPFSVQPGQQVICPGCQRFIKYTKQPLQSQHIEMPPMPEPETAPQPAPPSPSLNLTTGDEEIDFFINWFATSENSEKFIRLFVHGDISEYRNKKTGDPDHSAADAALLGLLSFHCKDNPERLERLFSMSALGQRDKWKERSDYRVRSIDETLHGRHADRGYYTGPDLWQVYSHFRQDQKKRGKQKQEHLDPMSQQVLANTLQNVIEPVVSNGYHKEAELPVPPASAPPMMPPFLAAPDFAVANGEAPRTVTAMDLAIAAQSGALEEHWKDVVELPKYEVGELPIESLPASLSAFTEYTEQVAVYTQTSSLASFMMALAGISMIVGERCKVVTNWSEILNLYMLLVLPPGSRKSAIYDEYYRVISAIEKRVRKDTDADLMIELGERERIVEEVKQAQKKLAAYNGAKRGSGMSAAPKATIFTDMTSEGAIESSTVSFNPDQIKDWLKAQYEEMSTWRPLAHFSRIVDDVTPEKLAGMLLRQGGFMCVASDEGGTFFKHMTGLYGRTSNNDVFLKGHQGGELKVARSSEDQRQGIQDAHQIVPEARLSITLAIQPGVLSESVQRANGELAQSGFMGRFAYVFPKSNIGFREADFTKLPQPEDWARAMYERGLNLLFNHRKNPGWLPDDFVFSPQAYANFVSYCKTIETAQKPSGMLYELKDWGWASKMPGLVMRLAGLIHVAKHVMQKRSADEMIGPIGAQIDEETLATAYMIGNILISHAHKAFGRVQRKVQEMDRSQYVLDKLKELHDRGKLENFDAKGEVITMRELMRACRLISDIKELKEAVTALSERGYVKMMLTGSASRQFLVVNKTVWIEE